MRKWLIILMTILCVGLAAAVVVLRTSSDRQGPEITFDEDKSDAYKENMKNSVLLKHVKAADDKDGDVSDTLTVESVYENEAGTGVTVIYVAKDKSNNVTKAEFNMKKTGSEHSGPGDEAETETDSGKKQESGTEAASDTDEEEPVPAPEKPAPTVTEAPAESETAEEEKAAAELAADEEQARKTQEDKITRLTPQSPHIYLHTYYARVPAGTDIDRMTYVASIEDDVDDSNALWRQVHISGTADTNTPGSYELAYSVVDSNGNTSNEAVLTIVVE